MPLEDAKIDPSLAEYMPRIEEMYNAPFEEEQTAPLRNALEE